MRAGSAAGHPEHMNTKLHRKMDGKMFAGICTVIADRTNLDLNVARLAVAGTAVVGTFVGIGLAVPFLYLLAWILIPADDTDVSPAQRWLAKPEVRDAVQKASDGISKKL
jgi:phage shock protein PspC (stress-responsive transcriptional regulator)